MPTQVVIPYHEGFTSKHLLVDNSGTITGVDYNQPQHFGGADGFTGSPTWRLDLPLGEPGSDDETDYVDVVSNYLWQDGILTSLPLPAGTITAITYDIDYYTSASGAAGSSPYFSDRIEPILMLHNADFSERLICAATELADDTHYWRPKVSDGPGGHYAKTLHGDADEYTFMAANPHLTLFGAVRPQVAGDSWTTSMRVMALRLTIDYTPETAIVSVLNDTRRRFT